MRAVNLVDYHDGQQAFLQCFAQYESCLRLRAFIGIHHQNHAVHHLHHTLYLGTEVGVPRGVYNVDGIVIPVNGGIFCLNGNTFFTLQIHGVHGALLHLLVFSVGTACF